jgi:hypothetical protein
MSENVFCVVEQGVRPWEQEARECSRVKTITLAASVLGDLLVANNSFFESNYSEKRNLFLRTTLGTKFPGNRMLESKYYQMLKKPRSGFGDAYVGMQSEYGIPCTCRKILLPAGKEQYESMTDCRYSVVIVTEEDRFSEKSICDLLMPFLFELDAESLCSIVERIHDSVLLRACDGGGDAFPVLQFIGLDERIDHAMISLRDFSFEVGDRDEIYEAMRI